MPTLPAVVTAALAAGAARVQGWVSPEAVDVLAAAVPAGLRREGVARQPSGPRILLGRLADDVDPDVDGLPTIATGFDRVIRAAGWLIRDEAGRVLLLETTYKKAWDVPGGIVEPHEDLVAAAHRELAEELALELPLGRLLVLDFCLDDGRRYDIELVLFDGGTHPPDLLDRATFVDGEIAATHWVDLEHLETVAAPGTARRIRAALDVLGVGPAAPAALLREGRLTGRGAPD